MSALTVERVCEKDGRNTKTTTDIVFIRQNIDFIDDLSKFTKVVKVDLSWNDIHDAKGLSECKLVKWLNMAHNQLSSLAFVSKMKFLSVLNLGNNLIRDMSPVEGLRSLNALVLNNNKISDVKGLDNLHSLNALILSHNELKTIDVSSLGSLNKLQLSHNMLTDFPVIKFNYHLKTLSVNHNQIKEVPENCIGVNWLVTVDLSSNPITKMKKVSALCSVKSIKHLMLRNAPLTQADGYVQRALKLFPGLISLDNIKKDKLSLASPTKRKKTGEDESSTVVAAKKQKVLSSDLHSSQDGDSSPTKVKKKEKKKRLKDASPTVTNSDSESEIPVIDSKISKQSTQGSKGKDVEISGDQSKLKKKKKMDMQSLSSEVGDTNNKEGMKSKVSKDSAKEEGKHKVLRKAGTFAPKDSESGVLAIKEQKKRTKVEKKPEDIFGAFNTDIGSGTGSGW